MEVVIGVEGFRVDVGREGYQREKNNRKKNKQQRIALPTPARTHTNTHARTPSEGRHSPARCKTPGTASSAAAEYDTGALRVVADVSTMHSDSPHCFEAEDSVIPIFGWYTAVVDAARLEYGATMREAGVGGTARNTVSF